MYMKYSQNKAFDFNTMSKDGRFEKIASRIFLFMMITIAVIVCLGENAYAAKNPNYEVRSNTGLYSTSASYHSNWSYVSQLQQFSYKDEGLAYADNGTVYVKSIKI